MTAAATDLSFRPVALAAKVLEQVRRLSDGDNSVTLPLSLALIEIRTTANALHAEIGSDGG